MAFLDPILNPILNPLLNFSPFWGIIIITFLVSLFISFIYKLMTDQTKMKEMKQKQKDFQKQMKELKDNPEQMMALQKEAMGSNMEYMKASLKPTLVTFIPIILLFGWMTANLAYEPIFPGETFSLTATFADGISGDAELIIDDTSSFSPGTEAIQTIAAQQASWSIKSDAGTHDITVKVGDIEETRQVLITTDLDYLPMEETFSHSDIAKIDINYKKLRPAGEFALFGWQPGWLGWYIIFSLVFSLGIRRVMGLH